jgi:signal transduction histidine kinase
MASDATHYLAPPTEPLRSRDYGTGGPADVEGLLRAAAESIARAPHPENPGSDEGSTRAALSALVETVLASRRGVPLPPLERFAWTAEASRLITELRRGVLAGARASAVPADDVLSVLADIERLLEALEQDVAARFVEHLVGPHALQLLVEVAHDVRSPLGSILFLVDRMRRGDTGPVSPMQERHLGLVYSAAFGLAAMASDAMELALGGARLVGPEPVPFSIAALMHAVRDVVQPLAEEKGLTLRFSGPAEDIRIGHPAAITRVLLNLVTNALKFTNNGSVTVTAFVAGGDEVCFSVEDTGRGMPPGVAARVTEVFSREAGAPTYSFSSAGLGIAICRKLVDTMSGSLSIAPVSPVGTRVEFTLLLPAR